MPNQGNLNANKGPQAARRVAAGIPPVELPEPDAQAESTFSVFHGVDNSDIASLSNLSPQRSLSGPQVLGLGEPKDRYSGLPDADWGTQ